MKFGGSSLADADRIRHVAELIAMQRRDYQIRPMVVCSAMGKSTNSLLAAGEWAHADGKVCMDSIRTHHIATCDELSVSNNTRHEVVELLDDLERLLSGITYLRELTPRTRDLLVSFGERMSVRLVASCLNTMGIPAQHFDSWSVGFRTNSDFGNADLEDSCYVNIKDRMSRIDDATVPVITGFIAQDSEGHVTTLGRGGSDLTAAVLGAACSLDEIQVWKDVDGMLTADPRVVEAAVPVPEVTFTEASELAYFGAKILHPVSMLPAMKANIPVRIKNSYNPTHPGTVISAKAENRPDSSLVVAITSKSNQVLLDITSTRMLGQYGFLSKLFAIFQSYKMSIDVIATSEVSVSLTLDGAQPGMRATWETVLDSLSTVAQVEMKRGHSIIALIANVDRSSDVLAAVFDILRKEDVQVEMMSQGASKVNISLVVKDKDLDRAVSALHRHFFELPMEVEAKSKTEPEAETE